MAIKTLAKIQAEIQDIERHFPHKALLYIGTESYDAPAITVLQGLNTLGFTTYTIGKPNINSWFANVVLPYGAAIPAVDFVLTDLHWGIRWSYYDKYNLHDHVKVLIDGADEHWREGWRRKYHNWGERYKGDAPEAIKQLQLAPYRWLEPIGDYEPDVVFVSQDPTANPGSYYLPFGIAAEYLLRPYADERDIDFMHPTGHGGPRGQLHELICKYRLPGHAISGRWTSGWNGPAHLQGLALKDHNIHSYHRWSCDEAYFSRLERSHVVIHQIPGRPWGWDSKRPYEAWARGAVLLFRRPPNDMSSYPITDMAVCDAMIFDDLDNLVEKCQYLYQNPRMERWRTETLRRACKYLTPEPIARYVLSKILEVS